MRERLRWTPGESVADRGDVLRLQGIPVGQPVSARILALLEEATALYVDLAEPRAIIADILPNDFAVVYRGEGRNPHPTPLEDIVPGAGHLALMAATVGSRVTETIRELFLRHEPALACMLDSVASAAADRLADLLESWYPTTLPDSARELRALAYSPGYCGWDISGQRALFEFLRPQEIGITLDASCLMQPLKSISGVLVAGPGYIHRFHPTYSFCRQCQAKQCRERIASVLRREVPRDAAHPHADCRGSGTR